ncbi:hypothetical protein M5K25_020992 [Dendrobium thyrsiflorum]|uniref:Uncharacterized protein n=1 Tax=Dendrobium thyrsiflorum TaxID=117978 RepID=A0ABD0UIB4_DENTH
MVRRSAHRSSPRSNEGSGGRKDSKHGNLWKVLEGKDPEGCVQALMAANVSSEQAKTLSDQAHASPNVILEACDSSSVKEFSAYFVASHANGGPAADIASNLSNYGDVIAKECRNFNAPLNFTVDLPNAWNRLEVFKIDDAFKAAVMPDDECSVTLNMESVYANIARLERELVCKLIG